MEYAFQQYTSEQFRQPVFETERLVAGIWHECLTEPAFVIYGDAEVTKTLWGEPESDLAAMQRRIEWLIARNSRWTTWGSFPVFRKTDKELVGAALIKPLPDAAGQDTSEIEIGWHLRRDCWGKGFATEFGTALLDYGFSIGKARELFAVMKPENGASQNVAKRIGMQHVGQTNRYYGIQSLELYRSGS